MSSDPDNFYFQQNEPQRSCLLALRDIILNYDQKITATWKYRMPCFCYNGKMFCYLWMDRKRNVPYILMVDGKLIEHPQLVTGDRARMKVFYVDPSGDIPVNTVYEIFDLALPFVKQRK